MPLFARGITGTASHLARAHNRRLFSSARSLRAVELAYQLFEPPAKDSSSSSHQRDGRPIVFMHGLFGSKQNNRSISKYV